jgi:hypothetical protein
LDELNVSGGIGSNGSGINGANNPNRKKKKKRRHRFDYVFQHQRNTPSKIKPMNIQMVATPSHLSGDVSYITASINNTQTGNRRFSPFSLLPVSQILVSISPVNQP